MADCTCQIPVPARGVLAAAVGPLSDPYPVPAYPPREWFYDKPDWLLSPEAAVAAHVAAGGAPDEAPIMRLMIDDEGRAAGYFQEFGQCLVHDHSACPVASPTHHSGFHQSNVVVEDGSQISVGIIANVGGHADPYAPVSVAMAHYADPNLAVVTGRAYDDEHGSYVLGAVVPWATFQDVAKARMHPLSGDWRPMAPAWWKAHGIAASVVRKVEGYDSIGPTFVNRPGLPLPRRAASVEDTMSDTAPVVVHQHFSTPPPGPVVDPARAAAVADAVLPEPAITAADAPPEEPPAEEQPDGDVQAQIVQLEGRVGALEDAVTQLIDLVSEPMAASAALPEPEPAPVVANADL